MTNRRRFLLIYLILYLILTVSLVTLIKIKSAKGITVADLDRLTNTPSAQKGLTQDPCRYQILGEPKVGNQYLKVGFWCHQGQPSRSTLALVAFPNQSLSAILQDYCRIVGLDFSVVKSMACFLNQKPIDDVLWEKPVPSAATLNCYQDSTLVPHD